MFYTTLNCYGTSGADGFICESETPETTDSSYTRHATGGKFSGEETISKQESDGIISNSKN